MGLLNSSQAVVLPAFDTARADPAARKLARLTALSE